MIATRTGILPIVLTLPLFANLPAAELKPPTADEIARMESAVPARPTAKPKRPRKLLVVTQCEGFPHSSIPYAAKALEIMGRKTGAFDATVAADLSILERPEFDTFDAIAMDNTTLRLPLLPLDVRGMDAAQKAEADARDGRARQRFLDFVRNGKGLVGIHAATDCLSDWAEYGELIGGYFDGHPWSENVRVKLDDPGHPLLAAFNGQPFDVADEIYQFRAPYSRERLRVLLSLDAGAIDMSKKGIKRQDKDFAVAWIREYGKGRVFYFSLGHRHEIFWNAPILRCYLDGIQYALGDLAADAKPSTNLSREEIDRSRSTGIATGLQNMLRDLATYTLDQGPGIPDQLERLVSDTFAPGAAAQRAALADGLATIAANPRATPDARALACRHLALIGTEHVVSTLAPLLTDDAMADWARHALTGIRGPAADRALIAALPRASGPNRIGIVGLLGARRVADAIPALASLLSRGDDTAAAVNAAESIGHIGGSAAESALTKARAGKHPPAVNAAIDRALLEIAETARSSGDRACATQVYARLSADATVAAHIRAAAFYGATMLKGESGATDAVNALRGDDVERARAAARLVTDLPGQTIVQATADALPALQPVSQSLALDALAKRGERSALPAVMSLLAAQDDSVRLAALRAIGRLGDASTVERVVAVASDEARDRAERDAARETLASMSGPGVDEALIARMQAAKGSAKSEYAKALGTRKARVAFPALIAAAGDSDAALAREARKALGQLAQPADLGALVALLVEAPDAVAIDQVQAIIVATAQQADTAQMKTVAILAALAGHPGDNARCGLLTALGKIGDPTGQPSLISALGDASASIRRAAIKALADSWPDAGPILALRDASRNDADEGNRVLALRGYARMLAMPTQRPMRETLALYREALELAKGKQEKCALIAGLGKLAHPDALQFVKPYFNDPDARTEAFVAALAITDNLAGGGMVLTASIGHGSERNAIDGSDKTRWTTGKHMAGGEWFMIDLGYETELRELFLDAGPTGADQPRGYEVYVSLDGKTWGQPVATGGDPGKKAFTIAIPPTYGRFIKIVQTGQAGLFWSINELRVNGLPDHRAATPLDRTGWTLSASRSGGGSPPENAIGGNSEKRWGTGGPMRPDDWFMVDLGAEHVIHAVVMDAAKSGNDYPREYRIETSLDGQTWVGPVGASKGTKALTTARCLPTRARYVKIQQTGSHDFNWWSIHDLQILGE